MAKSVPPGSADTSPKKRAPRQLPTSDLPPDNLQAIFGRNLRVARLRKGMTLAELAEAVGTSVPYLSQVENGEKNVTLDTMRKLAAAIGQDVRTML